MLNSEAREVYKDCIKILDRLLEGSWDPSITRGVKVAQNIIRDRLPFWEQNEQTWKPPSTPEPKKIVKIKETIWKKYHRG